MISLRVEVCADCWRQWKANTHLYTSRVASVAFNCLKMVSPSASIVFSIPALSPTSRPGSLMRMIPTLSVFHDSSQRCLINGSSPSNRALIIVLNEFEPHLSTNLKNWKGTSQKRGLFWSYRQHKGVKANLRIVMGPTLRVQRTITNVNARPEN